MTAKKKLQEEAYFQIIRLMETSPQITQRELAGNLGISLGKVNYCINALMAKGWIKLQNFSASPKKIGYVYLLTPEGIKQRTLLTAKFLSRKIKEYEQLKVELAKLKIEVKISNQGSENYD